ncbi:VapE domain-containing protein [Pseudomonas brassicacearum]|uniref:Zinc finger CHC2-type domain-containing protein n=1 Tax=Pseudomonas brassicacearum TaxID=930166 RepID=A0A423H1Y1_9PSED|nr:VapE domain-containing protein [Pseudomonas brassicacearum]RON06232.1 hypothetical protein BK658_00125 [Pseudomonas brassicacearum]
MSVARCQEAAHRKIPESTLERAKSDIVGTISKYVELEKNGSEFTACCPFHKEKSPSFSVVPDKGMYYCFGCGAGGDAIDFVVDFEQVGFRDAVSRIVGDLLDATAVPAQRSTVKAEVKPEWVPIVPVPADTKLKPKDIYNIQRDGEWKKLIASKRWDYLDANGALIGCISRFEKPGAGKEVIPQAFCVNTETGEMSWRWQSFSKPRPMYGLNKIAKHQNAQIVIVEGEKACDAGQQKFLDAGISLDQVIVISWPGGGKAVPFVDWTPLTNRSVGLWPDADQQVYVDTHPKAGQLVPFLEQPGTAAMLDIFDHIADKASAVKFIVPPTGVACGWDLADENPEGFQLLPFLKANAMLAADVRERFAPAANDDASPVTTPSRAVEAAHEEAAPVAEFEPIEGELQSPWLGSMSPQKDQMPAEHSGLPPSANLDGGVNELGIFPLGRLGSVFGFWRCDSATVELLRAADLERVHGLVRLASLQRWEHWSEGKLDKAMAANALTQRSIAIGEIDLSRVPEEIASAEYVRAQYNLAMLHTRPSGAALAGILSAREDWSTAVHFDEFAQRVVVEKELPGGGSLGPWTDNHDMMLGAWCASILGVTLPISIISDGVMTLARQRSRHPVRDYLKGLAWDGVPRLSKWLIECAGADDDAYHRAVAAKTLIGAAARVLQPGSKMDTALVLEGPQGLKKSSLIRALVPDVGWFAENLGSDDLASKDAMLGLQGRWVVELAELSGLRRSEVNTIKSFLARRVDTYRAPYGRRTEEHPRQAIFIGSVNPDADGAYLRDSTGGRRFWPVACKKIDVELLISNRDQLWAEAVARFNDGEPWWLSHDLETAATVVQAERLETNPWSEHVARHIDYLEPSDRGLPWTNKRAVPLEDLTSGEVFKASQGRDPNGRDMADLKLIAGALKELGWSSGLIRRHGRRIRGWKR